MLPSFALAFVPSPVGPQVFNKMSGFGQVEQLKTEVMHAQDIVESTRHAVRHLEVGYQSI